MESRFHDGVKVYGVWCTYLHLPPKLPKCIRKLTIHWVSGKIIIVYFTHPSTATYILFVVCSQYPRQEFPKNHILLETQGTFWLDERLFGQTALRHWSSGNVSNKSKQDLSAYTLTKHDTSQWMSPVNQKTLYIEPLKWHVYLGVAWIWNICDRANYGSFVPVRKGHLEKG